jgi:hypothetical protein
MIAQGRVKVREAERQFAQSTVAAVTLLPVQSCLIGGEAIVCNGEGLAVFDLIREYRHDTAAVLEQAGECRLYAERCADKAQLQSDPQLRTDYLEMQRRWLGLLRAATSSQNSSSSFRPLRGIKSYPHRFAGTRAIR